MHNDPTSYSSLARIRASGPHPKRKQVLNRRLVSGGRRETKSSTHGQVEASVIRSGGPNPLTLKSLGMNCG